MRIAPFAALYPRADAAAELAAVPYDTVDASEAAALAQGKPRSFLRISRAEIELPQGTDPHGDAVYARAASNFERWQDEGVFVREPRPCLYIYRITKGDHVQTGVVACCHVDEYASNIIRRHEKTRADKETDRTRHTLALRAHSGPVFLTYRDRSALDRLVAEETRGAPFIEVPGEDGTRHSIWRVQVTDSVVRAFAEVPLCYIADGHHRAAASARAATQERASNPRHAGDESYNWFLTVLFPAGQLRILPYHRCVKDLNGLSADAFLRRVGEAFVVTTAESPLPQGPCRAHMYLQGRWYALAWAPPAGADPVSSLDVSVLQDRLLRPILGIEDPRTNPRIEFSGGIRGPNALVKRVESGAAAVAFAMYPVTVEDMIRIADAGQIMPPKSTWFEPKLRSGLLIHTF